jgi:hypothetical protein
LRHPDFGVLNGNDRLGCEENSPKDAKAQDDILENVKVDHP